MTEFVPTVALATLVIAVINFLKYVRNADVNGALTQLSAWVAGVAAVMIAAHTDWAGELVFGTVSLHEANAWSQLFVGLTVASAGSFLVELRKALDNTDSAVKPPLITSTGTVVEVEHVPQGYTPPA